MSSTLDQFRTDGPFIAIPRQACLKCHDMSDDHSYLYTIGNVDFYRCNIRREGKRCVCGEQYEVRGMALSGDATPEQVERAMSKLAEGAGEVIDPRRIS